MDTTTFKSWLSQIASLTEPQRRSAWQALGLSEAAASAGAEAPGASEQLPAHAKPAAAAQIQPASPPVPRHAAERGSPSTIADLGQCRVDSVGCPHCDNRDVVRWGRASDLPRYRCKACLRTFNALTKTPLAKLRMKEKWAAQTEAMIDGVSLAQAAQRAMCIPPRRSAGGTDFWRRCQAISQKR
jgi:hypothetical protein